MLELITKQLGTQTAQFSTTLKRGDGEVKSANLPNTFDYDCRTKNGKSQSDNSPACVAGNLNESKESVI